MKKIRWGVLGASNFALTKTIPAMQKSELCSITAIASRDLAKARKAAGEHTIPKAYGSYEELLADAEIEAIYNPLPNHLHVEWSIKALEAGKHVLCEKPIGLTAEEAKQLLKASERFPNLKIMEAFMYRLHPQWQKAKALVQEGKVGELKTIQCFFSFYNTNPKDIRNIESVGGGGMLDIGCYCISLARFIFDKEPVRVTGIIEYDPVLKTDRMASGMLDFSSGTSTFTCSTQLSRYQRVNILGTTGRVEIEIPFNAPLDEPTKIWHHTDKGSEELVFTANQYTIQGDLFANAILKNTAVPTPLTDAVANMKVIGAVIKSAKSGRWEMID